MKPVKELKPNKFKAYDPFQSASYTFQGGDKFIKDYIDHKRKVG
jgi:hypothetical protein